MDYIFFRNHFISSIYKLLRFAAASVIIYKLAKVIVFGLHYNPIRHITYSSSPPAQAIVRFPESGPKQSESGLSKSSESNAIVAGSGNDLDNSIFNWKKRFIELNHSIINSYSPSSIFFKSSLFETIWPELSLSPAFSLFGGGPYQVHPVYKPCKRQNIQLPEFQQDPKSPRTCSPMLVPPGLVSVDWYGLDNLKTSNSKNTIVVLIPGLTGCSDALYIKIAAETLSAKGFACACYNPRGRGGNVVETPFLYSVGYTEDVRRVFQKLFEEYPNTSFIAVGFSLGGGVLTKYVGEEAKNCRLKGAMAICSPIDCIPMSNHITHSLLGKMVIDPLLVSFVKEMAQMHENILKDHHAVDLEAVKEARTMWEFDGSIIAPMMGFKSASEYYRRSSAGLYLYDIAVPMLFLHAENDPIVPGFIIRRDDFTANPYLMSVITNQGGHSMVFPQNSLFISNPKNREGNSWSSNMILRYCETLCSPSSP